MDELIRGRPEYEMRLYTLCLVKTSISFWERQEIKTEVENFFSKNCNYEWKPEEWHGITKKVLNFADTFGLVATVLLDLKDAIINTGMKMFDWIMYVHWDYGLDITHALPILWTPLGFVDEDKIFKTIWVNDDSLYHGSPDKPIFRLACLLAQEDFIREHASEMIKDLDKLPMQANSDDLELEVVDYSDKVYGIMSTYICYFVNRDWQNKDYYFYASGIDEWEEGKRKEELEQREYQEQTIKDTRALRGYMEEAMNDGIILPPEKMAKLSGWPGLLHAVKYYLKKLNSTQKEEVDKWLLSYLFGRTHTTIYNIHCRNWRFWETSALVTEHWEEVEDDVQDDDVENDEENDEEDDEEDDDEYDIRIYIKDPLCRYLHACPLESVLWPMVRKLLNNVETTREQLNNVLDMTFDFMEVDQYFGIPNTRYFYQKLAKKIFATFDRRKMQGESSLMSTLETYCWNIHDFTWLRTAYETNELIKFKADAEFFRQRLFIKLSNNLEVCEKFFDQLFVCPDDRIRFLLKMFPQCERLRDCEFDMWEKLYSSLNIISAHLRNSIDPIKCLDTLASDLSPFLRRKATNIEKCEEFIKWWHGSNVEDQANLKEKFKESSFPSECIYKYWIYDVDEAVDESLPLLQWLFDSEDEITKFKQEKLSVLGLLYTSLTLFNATFDASWQENELYEAVDEFIIFCEMTPERLGNEKDEIRNKIEELMCNFLTIYNIETFNFFMHWVSLSEETKKRIFQNLMDSSKILKLCENILNANLSETCMDVFYNEWILKYCDDISKLKRYLISNYESVRSERFMSELFSLYETLERGERLSDIETLYDFYNLL